ncbi:hypothetical protein FIC_00551 [Flavobacteriaceae bacterium 3519-10]|nr:hypothetical protein FIC_00551 [Flavobacteriaceae bacterium 3519-10]
MQHHCLKSLFCEIKIFKPNLKTVDPEFFYYLKTDLNVFEVKYLFLPLKQ